MKAEVALDLRGLLQAELTAIERVVIVGLLSRYADQATIERVVPAVIAADKGFRAPLLGAAERVAAMTAGVEKNIDLGLAVANDDDLVLADVIDEVVAGIGNLRVVAHEIPATR